MKSSRIKPPALTSVRHFFETVDSIAREMVILRQLEARRDEALQETRRSFEPILAAPTENIKNLTLLAASYAAANKDDVLPGKHKSAETTLAKYGFRTGSPTVKARSGWTMKAVLTCIRERKLLHFLRQPEVEIDKNALLAARKTFKLEEIGIRVFQDEGFFIEPKDQAEGVS